MRRVLAPLLLLVLLVCATDGFQRPVRDLVQKILDPRAFEAAAWYASNLPPPPEDIYLTDIGHWHPTTRADSLSYEQGQERARRIEADSIVLRDGPTYNFGPQSETIRIVTRVLERRTGKHVRFDLTEDLGPGVNRESFWYGYEAIMLDRLQPMFSVREFQGLLYDALSVVSRSPSLLLEKQRLRSLIHAVEPNNMPPGKDYVAVVDLTVSDEGRVLRNDTRVVEVASVRPYEWSVWATPEDSELLDAAPTVTGLVRRETEAWTFAPISPEWAGLGVERNYHRRKLLRYGSW